MSRPPQYAPKSRFRTRQSGSEVDAIDDNSATAIDRIVPDLDQLEREYGQERRPRPEGPPPSGVQPAQPQTAQPQTTGPTSSRALVIGLAIALGLAVVLAAVLGAAVVFLLMAR